MIDPNDAAFYIGTVGLTLVLAGWLTIEIMYPLTY